MRIRTLMNREEIFSRYFTTSIYIGRATCARAFMGMYMGAGSWHVAKLAVIIGTLDTIQAALRYNELSERIIILNSNRSWLRNARQQEYVTELLINFGQCNRSKLRAISLMKSTRMAHTGRSIKRCHLQA